MVLGGKKGGLEYVVIHVEEERLCDSRGEHTGLKLHCESTTEAIHTFLEDQRR